MLLSTAISEVNLLAVLVTAIIHTVIGLVWFQPKIFGNKWAALTGASLNPAGKWIPAGLIAHLVMSFVLAIFIILANATTLWEGAVIGAIACIGFMATLETGEALTGMAGGNFDWERLEPWREGGTVARSR